MAIRASCFATHFTSSRKMKCQSLRGLSSTALISLIALAILIPGMVVASYYSRVQPLNNNSNLPASSYTSAVVSIISFPATEFSYNIYSQVIYAIGSGGAHSVLEINATTNRVIGQIMLPEDATANSLGFDYANRELYVSLTSTEAPFSSNLIAISTISNSVVKNFTLTAARIAIDPARDIIYAAVSGISSTQTYSAIVAINGRTNEIQGNTTLFSAPVSKVSCCYEGQLMYDPITNYLYQSLGYYTLIGTFNPFATAVDLNNNTVFAKLQGLSGTNDFAYDPVNGYALVSNNGFYNATGGFNSTRITGGDSIIIFNRTNPIALFPVGSPDPNETVGGLAFDSLNNRIYAAFGLFSSQDGFRPVEDNLAMIDAASARSLLVTSYPDGIVTLFIDPVNFDIYVATPSFIYANAIS